MPFKPSLIRLKFKKLAISNVDKDMKQLEALKCG